MWGGDLTLSAGVRCQSGLSAPRDADQSDFKRELSEEQKDYVYHAELYIDGQRIMMADNLDILFRPSTALSLTVTMSRKEEVLAAFEVLEDGGEVIYPPHSTTYSSCTTNVIDRFGFRWVIMTKQTEH